MKRNEEPLGCEKIRGDSRSVWWCFCAMQKLVGLERSSHGEKKKQKTDLIGTQD